MNHTKTQRDYLGWKAQEYFADRDQGDSALRIISSIAARQARSYDWLAAALSEHRITLDELIEAGMVETVLVIREDGWQDGAAAVEGWKRAAREFYGTLEFLPRTDPKDKRILRDLPQEEWDSQDTFVEEDRYDFIEDEIEWNLDGLSEKQHQWVRRIAQGESVTVAWRAITGDESPRSHTNWLRKALLDANPSVGKRLGLVQCAACSGKARNCKTCASAGWTTADGGRIVGRG